MAADVPHTFTTMLPDISTRRLFRRYTVLFAVFAIVLVAFQWQRERTFRREMLEARLEGYADIIAAQDTLAPPLTAEHLRTTVIATGGRVLYDSHPHLSPGTLPSHLQRPEVQQALKQGWGYDIRQSATTGEDFFYYAKRYAPAQNRSGVGCIVRVALPYGVAVSHNLHTASNVFFWFALLVFAGTSLMLVYTGGSVGHAVRQARRREKARTQAVKRQISTNIAHELRTPVAVIRGYLETLAANPGLGEERKANFIGKALAQAERLTDLIRDVSLISKTEASPSSIPRENLRLADVVRGAVEDLRGELDGAGVRVSLDFQDGLVLRGNYTLLYAIFRNLLENTVRYAGRGVEACLTCRRVAGNRFFGDGGDRLSLVYYDTGRGVGEEHLERIFERFYRVDEGRVRDGRGGTGLGLSIVRNAVAFHGGDIVASNRAGGGLQFDFTLKVGV